MRRRMIAGMGGPQDIQFVGSYDMPIIYTTSRTLVFEGNLTGGIGNGVQPGDLVCVYAVNTQIQVFTVDAGWTQFGGAQGNDTYDIFMNLYYKIMGPVPDTSFTASIVNSRHFALGCSVFRNVDQSTPTTTPFYAGEGVNSGIPIGVTSYALDYEGLIYAVAGGSGDDVNGRRMAVFTKPNLEGFSSIAVPQLAVAQGYITPPSNIGTYGGGGDVSTTKSWGFAGIRIFKE